MWQDFYKIFSGSSWIYDKNGVKSRTESKSSKIKQTNTKTENKQEIIMVEI